MELGSKILEYRKKYNLSQEDLAKEIGVARQTISKWELNETTPDLKQAIKLAELFNIGLDEFTNNIQTKNETKERKTGKIPKVIIFVCYIILLLFIIEGIAIAFYYFGYNINNGRGSVAIVCTLENEEYGFAITYDDTHDILMTEGSPYIYDNIYKRKKYENAVELVANINNYFKEKGGYCE